MKKSGASQSASELISKRIAELDDWRGETLSRMRTLIREADPDVVEEWKWMGTPVWSHAGIICTGESYKKVVKLTFSKGASLKDPGRLFNSSLDGNVRRAIDIHEGEAVDGPAFKALVRQAVALNSSGEKKRPRSLRGSSTLLCCGHSSDTAATFEFFRTASPSYGPQDRTGPAPALLPRRSPWRWLAATDYSEMPQSGTQSAWVQRVRQAFGFSPTD